MCPDAALLLLHIARRHAFCTIPLKRPEDPARCRQEPSLSSIPNECGEPAALANVDKGAPVLATPRSSLGLAERATTPGCPFFTTRPRFVSGLSQNPLVPELDHFVEIFHPPLGIDGKHLLT